MNSVTKLYDFVFRKMSDERVHNWPLIANPWGIMGITAMYLIVVFKVLPAYMANRKPYSLKRIIMAYNIYQLVACIILIYGVATSGWTTYYTLGCQEVDYSRSQLGLRMAKFMWWHMILKMTELIETAFFVLRKKFNQVSSLHVYHHVSTFIMAWICCKYFAGGMFTFTVLVNSFIHIFMYAYYLLTSLGTAMQRKLQVVKSKLTLLQMIQLCVIFIHSTQIFHPSCQIPKTLAYIYLPNIAINIFLFTKFYKKSYAGQKSH